MEDIKDFFKHINTRLSSPLIFSFIISWLVCNWKVTIDLLCHDHDFLKVDGYLSYVNLIQKEVTWCSGVGWPIVGALLYTFGNPFLTAVIHSAQTFFQKIEDNWNVNIMKGGAISTDKYLTLRENLSKRREELEKVIKEESGIYAKLEEEITNNYAIRQELTTLQRQHSETVNNLASEKEALKRITDQNATPIMLQGRWKKETMANNNRLNEFIEIQHHQYSIIENEKSLYKGNVRYYHYDEKSRSIFFVIEFLKRTHQGQAKNLVNEVKYSNIDGTLVGYEDGDLQVKYFPVKDEK